MKIIKAIASVSFCILPLIVVFHRASLDYSHAAKEGKYLVRSKLAKALYSYSRKREGKQ